MDIFKQFDMRFNTLFAIIAIWIFAAGCKSKIAIDYNNLIAKKQKSLNESMDATEPQLKIYFANYDYDSIASVSGRMESKIDSILHDLATAPAPAVKQGQNFKKAALNYFDYMKSIYTSYKNYGLQTTPQGRQFQLEVMSKVTAQEDRAIADMQAAQKVFAKDNNFKIQSAKKNKNSSLTANPPN